MASESFSMKGWSLVDWLKGIFAVVDVKTFVVKNAEALKLLASTLVGMSTGWEWYMQIIAGLVSKGILDVIHYFVSE